jgi:protein phosphatase
MDNTKYLKNNKETIYKIDSFSHRGLVRSNNEDNLAVHTYETTGAPLQRVLLAVLADGVGGHSAGEVASRIGIETIPTVVADCQNLDDPGALLKRAIVAANQAIVTQAQQNESYKGMGSTCVCALIIGNQLTLANLGDSRMYLVRDEEIQQLTYDHTWLEEIIRMELPGAEKITRSHPMAHVLNRYLGSSEPIEVDLRIRQKNQEISKGQGLQLLPEDVLILTSDGISDLLNDEEIMEIALKSSWKKIAKTLVYFALKKGGHDNATAISIKVP